MWETRMAFDQGPPSRKAAVPIVPIVERRHERASKRDEIMTASKTPNALPLGR